jgi:ABC-type multidrug transport system ATPase subunit
VLEVRDLTKRYKANLAVDGLSFKAQPGHVLGFLGPNGAGKTTTLRMLLGLTLPTSGSTAVDGRPYRQLRDPITVVGAVLEGPQFHPGRTGRNHLRVLAMAAGLPQTRVDEVLRLVELDGAGSKRVKAYSLGMRQRLGLAAALMQEPELLVLDEPTNGLDPQGIREIRELLLALHAGGATIFLSSHLLAEVEALCTRVGVLDRGRLVVQDQLETLRAPTGRTIVRTPNPAAAVAALDGRVEYRQGELVIVRGSDPAEVNAALVARGIPVTELARERHSLEEIIFQRTGPSSDRVDPT